MGEPENIYDSLRSRETLDGLTDDQALEHIGYLTDLSLDLRENKGLEHAVRLSEELQRRNLSPERHEYGFMSLHYRRSLIATRCEYFAPLRRPGIRIHCRP